MRPTVIMAGVAMAVMAFYAVLPVSAKSESPDTISVRRAFVEYPDPALDLLSRTTRMDMLDYSDIDSVYMAPNGMEGLSCIEALADGYIKVRITPVSTLQLKVLPLKKGGDVVLSIYTVGGEGQAPDSDVRFYSASLEEIPAGKYIKYPELKNFFDIPKGSITSQKEIDAMVPFPTVMFDTSAGDSPVKASLTVGEYISQDDYNILKLFLKPEISYIWDGRQLRLQK